MLELAEAARSAVGQTNVHFRLGEIGVLPLEDGAYDVVTCHNLLPYVLDVPALFTLFRRVLVADGRVALDEWVGTDDPGEARHPGRDHDPPRPRRQRYSQPRRNRNRAEGVRLPHPQDRALCLTRELDEWLARAAADEATRGAVRAMLEAGLDADSAGLNVRRSRDGSIVFTENRMRLLAEVQARPA